MSIQLDKRALVHAKVQMLAKRPEPVGSAQPSAAESFKFRLAAITTTDKGIESFPYGKLVMFGELCKQRRSAVELSK